MSSHTVAICIHMKFVHKFVLSIFHVSLIFFTTLIDITQHVVQLMNDVQWTLYASENFYIHYFQHNPSFLLFKLVEIDMLRFRRSTCSETFCAQHQLFCTVDFLFFFFFK